MKKKNVFIDIINVTTFILIVTIVTLAVILLSNENLFKQLKSLIIYYYTLGDRTKSSNYYYIYSNLINVMVYACSIILIIIRINRHLFYKIRYDDYPKIIHDHLGFTCFYLSGILILMNTLIIVNKYSIPSMTFAYFRASIALFIFQISHSLLFSVFGNLYYNNVNNKFKNKELDTKENKLKNYKSKYFIIIILIITLINSGFHFTKFVYKKDYTLPSSLVLKKDTALNGWGFEKNELVEACRFYDDTLHCSGRILFNYKLEKIEFTVESNDFIEQLESSEYIIQINYGDKDYYLSDDQYALEKTNNTLKYSIDFNPSDSSYGVSIWFINKDTLEKIEPQVFSEYTFTYVKK